MGQEKPQKETRHYHLKRENKVANDVQHQRQQQHRHDRGHRHHFILNPRSNSPSSTHQLPPSPSPHQLMKYVKQTTSNPHPENEKCCNQTWKRLSFPVILLICCGVGLAIGSIIWKQKQSSKNRNTDTNLNYHENDDMAAVFQDDHDQTQQRYEQLSSLVELYDMAAFKDLELQHNDTHRNMALIWMSHYDNSIAVMDVLQLLDKEEDLNHDQVQSFLERYALIVFYLSTNRIISNSDSIESLTDADAAWLNQIPTKWIRNDNWMSASDSICTWYGITCKNLDGDDGRDNHDNIFQHDDIKVVASLDLSFNNLEGTIPSEINLLKHLSTLNLSNNALEGGIPVDTLELDLLETLNLKGNNLSGSIQDTLCDNGASILVDVNIECNCC